MDRVTKSIRRLTGQVEELKSHLAAAEDRESHREAQLRWVLRELTFARIRLPIAEQLRLDDLVIELGV
jgi:hypothetical protein